jgi:hypothetical protein
LASIPNYGSEGPLWVRTEPFADNATIGCSLAHPEMLAAASPVCFRKITPIALASPRPPAPRRPAGLPSVSPQNRRRRLRPGAECPAVVDVGALGGDAADDILGGKGKFDLKRSLLPTADVGR